MGIAGSFSMFPVPVGIVFSTINRVGRVFRFVNIFIQGKELGYEKRRFEMV